MDIFSKLLNEVKIPKFVKINYTIKQSKIEDPAYEVKRVINERNIFNEIKKEIVFVLLVVVEKFQT